MLLPMVPFAYLAGSMAGGMLTSAGYHAGKQVVLEVQSQGGIGTVLPATLSDGANVGKEVIASLNINEHVTDFKESVVTTTEKGQILIQSFDKSK